MNNGGKDYWRELLSVNVSNCRARATGNPGQVACLTEIDACCWRYTSGDEACCAHSLNSMIAHASLPLRQFLRKGETLAESGA